MKKKDLIKSIARATNALGDVDGAMIEEFLEDAQQTLRREYDWPFQQKSAVITLENDRVSYPLPEDFDQVNQVFFRGRQNEVVILDPISDPDFYRMSRSFSSGIPRYWRQVGEDGGRETIELIPAPKRLNSYDLHLRYWKRPVAIKDLAEDDEPDWPKDFHTILKWGAVFLMALAQNDSSLMQSAATIYDRFRRQQENKYRLRYRQPYQPAIPAHLAPSYVPGRRSRNDYGRKR